MSGNAELSDLSDRPRGGRIALGLIGVAVASLIAAGLILWQHSGDAVFGDMVLAALAWCF